MSLSDEKELLARVSAADDYAHKCGKGHAIHGNNIYRNPSTGACSCWLCRIENNRERVRTPTIRSRRVRTPLSLDLVKHLRQAAGLPNDEG